MDKVLAATYININLKLLWRGGGAAMGLALATAPNATTKLQGEGSESTSRQKTPGEPRQTQ